MDIIQLGLTKLFQNVVDKINVLLRQYPTALIIIGGDYNKAPDNALDRFPPKSSTHSINLNIALLCNELSLVDIWRLHFPTQQCFAWHKKNNTIRSRLDFWLLSPTLFPYTFSNKKCTSLLTDHSAVFLNIKNQENYSSNKTNTNYWKCNTSLLLNDTFCLNVKRIIEECKNELALSKIQRWELFKL